MLPLGRGLNRAMRDLHLELRRVNTTLYAYVPSVGKELGTCERRERREALPLPSGWATTAQRLPWRHPRRYERLPMNHPLGPLLVQLEADVPRD